MEINVRSKACDPNQSFIVQAPAGSGKTELLTARFLNLLSGVNQPEEIIAVTFTKKAANEMRNRIIDYLQRVENNDDFLPHQEQTKSFAQKALAQDKKYQWNLLNNPNRLSIQTIDSLCHSIAKRMPLSYQFGGDFDIEPYAKTLYAQAIEAILQQDDESIQESVKVTLLHCDNRFDLWQGLLISLLQCRDQWLGYLFQAKNNESIFEYFNGVIQRQVTQALSAVEAKIRPCLNEIHHLMSKCLVASKDNGLVNVFAPFFDQSLCFDTAADDLEQWGLLKQFLLTSDGKWRKRVDKKLGFLAPSSATDKSEQANRKQMKQDYQALQESLQTQDGLIDLIHDIDVLPRTSFCVEQEDVLNALIHLLPELVGHLQYVFLETGKIDFIESMLMARMGLGDDLEPTDMALYLDYAISHILIDEYQDTSVEQYRFFSMLINQWQPNDGRTLFLVGDPMQSIYRFRGAEVGVFLHTKHQGLGNIIPEYICLKENYRSQGALIEWVNHAFDKILPKQDDYQLGSIAYSDALAVHPPTQSPVEIRWCEEHNQSVGWIIDKISELKKSEPQSTIAILVRKKNTLKPIIAELKHRQISFVAHDVLSLSQRPYIQDLLCLLKAGLNPTDAIAWYAVLRSPLIGLSSSDCFQLANVGGDTVWEQLINIDETLLCAHSAQMRKRFLAVFEYWHFHQQRKPLDQWLQGIWESLNGPLFYSDVLAQDEIKLFFEQIELFEQDHFVFDIDAFESICNDLKVDVGQTNDNSLPVECLTIHKSKGLEFDYVFMPDIQQGREPSDQPLILWQEFANESSIDYVIAAKSPHGGDVDSVYRYLAAQAKAKSAHELRRLFYVACTRARNKLFFSCVLNVDEEGVLSSPDKNSFLSMIWFDVKETLEQQVLLGSEFSKTGAHYSHDSISQRQRLHKDLYLPIDLQQLSLPEPGAEKNTPSVQNHFHRLIGTVFHHFVQQASAETINALTPADIHKRFHLSFIQNGLHPSDAAQALTLLSKALHNIQNDPRGQWIMSENHLGRQHEWELCVVKGDTIQNMSIDCSFIDENNNRWIIDFKLSGSADDFELSQEVERYMPQLQKYQRAVYQLEGKKPKIALYFPLIPLWWEPNANES